MSGLDFFDDGKVPMNTITIPPAALTAEQILAMHEVMEAAMAHMLETADFERDLAAAIAAAINAWPGVHSYSRYTSPMHKRPACEVIVLPLTKTPND